MLLPVRSFKRQLALLLATFLPLGLTGSLLVPLAHAATNEIQTVTATAVTGAATITVPTTSVGTGGTLTITPGDTAATVQSNLAAIASIGSTANVAVTGSTSTTASTPTFDNKASATLNVANVSITVGSGANRYLIAEYVSSNTTAITGMTYAGTAMTLLKRLAGTATTSDTEIWGLANPVSGANSVTVSSPNNTFLLTASSYTGVAQSSTLDTTAAVDASSTATLTTTQANDLLVDQLYSYSGGTANTGQTILNTGSVGAPTQGSSYKVATSAGSNSMGWSNSASSEEVVVALKGVISTSSGSYALTFQGALAGTQVAALTTASTGWSIAITQNAQATIVSFSDLISNNVAASTGVQHTTAFTTPTSISGGCILLQFDTGATLTGTNANVYVDFNNSAGSTVTAGTIVFVVGSAGSIQLPFTGSLVTGKVVTIVTSGVTNGATAGVQQIAVSEFSTSTCTGGALATASVPYTLVSNGVVQTVKVAQSLLFTLTGSTSNV